MCEPPASRREYATFVPSGEIAGPWLSGGTICDSPKPSALLIRTATSAFAIGAPVSGAYIQSPPGPTAAVGAPGFATWCSSSVSSCDADAPWFCCASSAAAPATCGAAADVPEKPDVPQPVNVPYTSLVTLSGPTSSGFMRPSTVEPCEL